MLGRPIGVLALGFGLFLAACASPSADSPAGASSDAVTSTKTAAGHFVCSTTDQGQWPLELLTQADGTVDATYGGGAVVLTGKLSRGKADLGQFLSGEYGVTLDDALLAGKAGTATLSDDEGPNNGGTSEIAYSCALAAPVAATFECTPVDASQYPLAITTTASGKVTADYAGGAISWDGQLAGGDSDLGQFLSGEYSVHLDTDVLDGNDGTVTLFDDEGPDNGGVDAIAYRCTPKAK